MGAPFRQRRFGTPPVQFDYNSEHYPSQAPPSSVAPEQPGADLPGNPYRFPQQTLQSKDLRLCPDLPGRNAEEPGTKIPVVMGSPRKDNNLSGGEKD